MKQEELTREGLTELLKEAEKAHAEYEYAPSYNDPDWAAWYAEFITNKLHENSSELAAFNEKAVLDPSQPH